MKTFNGRYTYYLILIFIWMQSQEMLAQSKDMWTILGMVTFTSSYNPDLLIETKIPKISGAIEKLDGKEIEIEGYMIPLTGQVTQSHFMLSKYPQSTCFFCGKAGPETAMQVFMKDNRKVKITERKVKVKGTLYINPKDASSLLYTLENAQLTDI
ncbi:MAG TPA: hypothetical protein PK611_01045 [Saprospiraceae bacterium]|nr:DUF3299 domain-containing protein [Saprospiraceae bacterium]HRO08814.1 hypothetical protein [Saprospiraceae bacterium]HRO72235.1 hypothetical protein [Saprospiraceae bacterium]HRP42097.1 hypothetical protein [Saprospiraceae bacterium]